MAWKKKKHKHDNDYYWKKNLNKIWHLISIEKNDKISVWFKRNKVGGGL
jgi:hypothetical protein